jgi:hypothetical protein
MSVLQSILQRRTLPKIVTAVVLLLRLFYQAVFSGLFKLTAYVFRQIVISKYPYRPQRATVCQSGTVEGLIVEVWIVSK